MDAATAVAGFIQGQHILSQVTALGLVAFMWPSQDVVNDGANFDFIIAGGGTAGCILASRLVRTGASVLLVEAGGQPPLESVLPGTYTLLKRTAYDWNLTTAVDNVAYNIYRGDVIQIQQGKLLGGSGQVNFQFHANGLPADYDEWAKTANDSSWGYNNMLKYIKKIESVMDEKILNSPDIDFHGTEGRIKIKKLFPITNEDYLKSYKELGHETLLDINANHTFGYTNIFFNDYARFRQSTANAYLKRDKDNPKLFVMYNALATKIIFDKYKKAVGLEILYANKKITVKADKEVILTAGVIKSAHLLMLSGIGPKAHLKSKNVPVLSDLPVGQNWQDHRCTILIFRMGDSEPVSPMDPFTFSSKVMFGNVALMTQQARPDYQVISGIVYHPDFFLQACAITYSFKNEMCDFLSKAVQGKQIYIVNHCLLYAKSRGEISLSTTNPETNPIVTPRFYVNNTDLDNHARCVVHHNRILSTTFFKSVNAAVVYPNLTACNGIQEGTMDYWKCYIKEIPTTLYMYLGTNAMGSVVDSQLRVKGVKNLRVGDASVIPNCVGAPPQATVMMVAERLAELLKKTHNL